MKHAQTYNHVCHGSVTQRGMGTTANRDTEPRRRVVEPPPPRGAMPTKVEILHDIAKRLRRAEVAHLTAEDEAIDGRLITIGRRRVVNFGSCSYLGLETDRRLVEGSQQATAKYGTAFSTSRAYLSAPPYTRLTALLSQLAGGRAVAIGSSTTLVHAAALPVVVARRRHRRLRRRGAPQRPGGAADADRAGRALRRGPAPGPGQRRGDRGSEPRPDVLSV